MPQRLKVKKYYEDKDAQDKKYLTKLYQHYCCQEETCVTAPGVFYTQRDAIVQVLGVTQTDSSTEPTQYQSGLGFLINPGGKKCYFVVTAAQNVLYSGPDQRIPAPANPNFVIVNQVYLTISHVNGTDCSYTYQAEIYGLDGSNDIALLKINCQSAFNNCLPALKEQPYFCWGRSRKYIPGQVAYAFSNPQSSNNTQFLVGNVANNNFYRRDSSFHFEGLSADLNLNPETDIGTPILDREGKVLAVYSYNQGSGSDQTLAVGVAQHLANHLVTAFVQGLNGSLSNLVDTFRDSAIGGPCDILITKKGYYGLSWHVFGSRDVLNVNMLNNQIKHIPVTGIVVDSVETTSPLFGIFNDFLTNGDIVFITEINKTPMGNNEEKVGPTNISNRSPPGSKVKVEYVVYSADSDKPCRSKVSVELIAYPTSQEFPASTVA